MELMEALFSNDSRIREEAASEYKVLLKVCVFQRSFTRIGNNRWEVET